jgi:DNA-binding response OmpR family regulator
MRVLVIEDETAILRVIKRGLEQAGFVVDTAEDGQAGLDAVLVGIHALIVLDLMLPKLDGWKVCEELRKNRIQTPILMLTARGAVEDRVRGLDLGADDYLPKPFDFAELLARIRALLRRDKVHRSRVFQVADLEVDTGRRRVTRGGVEIVLSRREYDLLEALAANEGQVLTREIIQENVWGDDESYSNTVDVYIGLLRKKIDNGQGDRLIHTVRGFGYALRRPEHPESAG